MSFSTFFTSAGLRKISVCIGVLVGIGVWMLGDWRVAVLVGAIVTLVTSLLLPTLFYIVFLPYARLKKTLPKPFLFDEPVQFTVKSGRVSGFLVLTEKSMVFLSRECQTQTMELTRDKIQRTVVGKDPMTLDIYLSETQFIRVFSTVREELVSLLRENGWNVTE
ncbi:MAG: hypothetical protein IJW29_04360 [Clostridia bacterium]|nr:hypothetical protein [Clostridia bacterium]